MNTFILDQQYTKSATRKQTDSLLARFINWTRSEQENRIAWLGVAITLMTAIFFPATMVSILLHGASFKFIIGAMFALILVVIPNLAALPTQYTIPAFFTGVLIDIVLIGATFFI